MQKRPLSFTLAGILLSLGIFLFFSIYMAGKPDITGFFALFTVPGRFLFTSFLWAAYYVPFYLGCLSVFLFVPGVRNKAVVLLTLSLVPFVTVTLLLRMAVLPADFPISRFFISTLGSGGSFVVLVILISLELAGIMLLGYRMYTKEVEELHPLDEKKREPMLRLLEQPLFSRFEESPVETAELEDIEAAEEKRSVRDAREDHAGESRDETPGLLSRLDAEDAEFQEVDGDEAPGPEPQESAEKAVVPSGRTRYSVPVDSLLTEYPDGRYWEIDEETERSAELLKKTLEEFKIQADVTGIRKGPVVTMFEILPAPGVKLSKITNLADNIALKLAATSVRIVAPIPGKHAVGIEVPNKKRNIVSFKEMVQDDAFDMKDMELPIVLGKDISGNAQIVDLTQTPHLLIAGATGSGKSVCVNSIICSILFSCSPTEARLLLIDPKIVELKFYNDIPHLLTPVITDPKKAFQALQYCLYEMERRYSLLDALGVRDVSSYNKKVKRKKLATEPLPYLIIIVDEFADLMATSGKELESTLARLAAMSRAIGIHLVLATQRPSIDVITGLIKANIPSRIAFMVAGKFDSRIIIDSVGAEKLLGKGDMLFTSAWNPVPTRIQGAFLSEEEVEFVTDHIKTLGKPEYIDEEIFIEDEEEGQGSLFTAGGNDPLLEKALDIVLSAGKASASYLQRRLKIGYNRAARLVEEMEERGIVGPQQGSKPREIIHVPDWYK